MFQDPHHIIMINKLEEIIEIEDKLYQKVIYNISIGSKNLNKNYLKYLTYIRGMMKNNLKPDPTKYNLLKKLINDYNSKKCSN